MTACWLIRLRRSYGRMQNVCKNLGWESVEFFLVVNIFGVCVFTKNLYNNSSNEQIIVWGFFHCILRRCLWSYMVWEQSKGAVIWLRVRPEVRAAASERWRGWDETDRPAAARATGPRVSVFLCDTAHSKTAELRPRLNSAASHSPSHPEEDQQWLRVAQAGRWTSGSLRSPLPVRRRASGLQPSGVNLSDCQAKYSKRLAITQTVKGHTQFPQLFTQLEGPSSTGAKYRQN